MPSLSGNEKIRDLYSRYGDVTAVRTTDEYGFIVDQFKSGSESYSSSKMQWYLLIDRYGSDRKKFRKAAQKERLLEQGIPLALKGRIWRDLAHIENSADYYTLAKLECRHEYQIHVDVQRTFRHHFLFFEEYGKGQAELFRVLTALANHDPQVGYCQGMSDICAVLLMYFPEKEAFDVYLSLAKANGLRELFDANLSKLSEVMRLQHLCFSETIPRVYKHLQEQHVDFSIYGVSWYMTLFSRFNIRTVLRVWDFLFFYGFNVLIYFSAAVLVCFEEDILGLRNEQLIEFISKLNEMNIDEDILVCTASEFMKAQRHKFIQ
jgi:hypothetical protein